MHKYLVITVAAALLSACSQPLPDAPPSNRVPVPPRGTTDSVKSWNQVTKQESDAVLPFNQQRR